MNVFLKTGFCFVLVLFSCENGGGGFHDSVNNAIIPAVFLGIATESGELPGPDGRLVVGAGETVLDITLENSRNTEYELKVLGKDAGLVTAHEFVGLLRIRLALVCPEDGEDRDLDISLHLVPPAGRAQPADYPLPLKYALGKIQFLYIIPNAGSGPLTKLTLLFARGVPDLFPDDISVMVDDVNWGHPKPVLKIPGEPDAIYEIYEISINEITQAQRITVEVAPAGYGLVSKSVDVNVDVNVDNEPKEIKLLQAVAHDSGGTTTGLTLVFGQDIPGLSADDIKITEQGGSSAVVTKGVLERITAGVCELPIVVTKSGTIKITAVKSGYDTISDPLTVTVRYAIPVEFKDVSVNGSVTKTTTLLTLEFDRDIAEFKENDITLDAGTTGARKGQLTKTETAGIYELELTNIEAAGEIIIKAGKDGYSINPASKPKDVYYAISVAFKSVSANGSANEATTGLTLVFDKDVVGLSRENITVTGLDSTVTIGDDVTPTSRGTYTFSLSGITAAAELSVSVSRSGYDVSGSQTVGVHKAAMGIPNTGASTAKDIREKFNVTEEGTLGVTAAFRELSVFISGGGLASQPDVIQLGDYIDLEGGLTVAKYGEGADDATGGVQLPRGAATSSGDSLLRLIVVGINSFNGKNGNNTPHVVFHFQNIPVQRRMNATATNEGGYPASEMREYLVAVEKDGSVVGGNFLKGLKDAGVPEQVLWGPSRIMSKKDGQETINDLLWLPTEWEMFGARTHSVEADETEATQVSLGYYSDNSSRTKKANGNTSSYWVASANSNNQTSFCCVLQVPYPYINAYSATTANGCVPAFCVK
ncbi:MAG: DUF6273 domain-containing protein [Spirochaetaceae bacterium]|jgi:hypothetical protein|nr:DUF6273 domain-containing protein [Spirochaetaceae bacterium]